MRKARIYLPTHSPKNLGTSPKGLFGSKIISTKITSTKTISPKNFSPNQSPKNGTEPQNESPKNISPKSRKIFKQNSIKKSRFFTDYVSEKKSSELFTIKKITENFEEIFGVDEFFEKF